MNKVNKIIIAVVIIVAIVVGIFAINYFLLTPKETSSFDNKYMSGSFIGNVSKVDVGNKINGFITYKDKKNKIEYNMSSCKNASFLDDYLTLNGLKPETRNYNGVNWKVYTSQAVPNTNLSNLSENSTNKSMPKAPSKTYNVFICEANEKNQSYLIFITYETIGNNSKIQCDQSIYCELFTEYIEPLLSNIKFKSTSDTPEIYELLGISQSDFNQVSKYVEEYKKVNKL